MNSRAAHGAGAIFAVLGEEGDPGLVDLARRMAAGSPYRGEAEFRSEGGCVIGVQSTGRGASMAESSGLVVAVHGYVGNWEELARERHWRFPEQANDAEKLVLAFQDLGTRLFARLRGEWALIVWSRRERTVLAARDVVGCRPLFQHEHGGRLFLATEIRQVLAGSGAAVRCDPGAAADYHIVRFPEDGRTVFGGVRRVPGAVARTFQLLGGGLKLSDTAYWSPPPLAGRRCGEHELIEELRSLIDAAVSRATQRDGAAISLSGGMDSTTVWATLVAHAKEQRSHASRFRPYSNVYPGLSCDESRFIRSIHEFTGIEGVFIDTAAVLASDSLEPLADRIDLPHMPNALPVELVCEAAAADSHSVLLTGLGGDEWLGGSLDYIRELFYSPRCLTAVHDLWTVRLPARLGSVRQRLRWLGPRVGLAARLGIGRKASRPYDREAVIRPDYRSSADPIPGSWRWRLRDRSCRHSKELLIGHLDHLASGTILDFIEQQAAFHGLEVRHPLMDLDIIEFGFKVESRAFVAGQCHKWLLRRAMANRLPGDVLDRVETTVFTPIFSREQRVLESAPPPHEWALARLGVVDVDRLSEILNSGKCERSLFELIRLRWLDAFVAQRFVVSDSVV